MKTYKKVGKMGGYTATIVIPKIFLTNLGATFGDIVEIEDLPDKSIVIRKVEKLVESNDNNDNKQI